MANTFSIPSTYYKSRYKKLVTKQYPRLQHKGILSYISIHAKVYFGYYFSLCLGVTIAAYAINTSGLAKHIMNEVRRQQSAEAELKKENHSTLNAYISNNASLVIAFANGQRLGESLDGVRFHETPEDTYFSIRPMPSSLFSRSTPVKSFFISHPPNGTAILSLNCTNPGKYRFAIEITEQSGLNKRLFNQSFSCDPQTTVRYRLDINTSSYHDNTLSSHPAKT